MKKDDEYKMKCKLQELEDMDIKKAVTIIVKEAASFDEIFNSDNHSFQDRWSYIPYRLYRAYIPYRLYRAYIPYILSLYRAYIPYILRLYRAYIPYIHVSISI